MNQIKHTTDTTDIIRSGKAVLGIELGSTRIKAVLIGEDNAPLASGAHDWENRLQDGIWTYTLDDIWSGLQDSYAKMAQDVRTKYRVEITNLAAIGFSGMMHGYMAFDKSGRLLVPFRTWRNTITQQAASQLTGLFQYHIPQRWSIAHLYQAVLNGEAHTAQIDYLVTLAGYIHWQLTGERVLGVGEASGMFPIDIKTKDYHAHMIELFDRQIADRGFSWKLGDILPKVLVAGEQAGVLTAEGAGRLDISGKLQAGIPLCPPEGDAGTGMAATNSVAVRTGNVSAGTSVFGMVVMEKELSKVYDEIDLVTTPEGNLAGMVHCNNCTSDLNAWAGLFQEFAELVTKVKKLDSYVKGDNYGYTVCHNDTYSPNYLVTGEDKMYLIDWEYAGMNDPANDLGCILCRDDFSRQEIEDILTEYFGRSLDWKEHRHYVSYIAISGFYWFCWGLYKGSVNDDDGFFFLPAYRSCRRFINMAIESYEKSRDIVWEERQG